MGRVEVSLSIQEGLSVNLHVNVNAHAHDEHSPPLPNLYDGSNRNRLKDRIHVFARKLDATYLLIPDRT